MVGICSYGGYVPRYRLNRGLIFKAMGWMNAGNASLAKGEKAVANFDEDTLTMAVAAGIDALGKMDRSQVDGLYLASTTLPYKERLNAGIAAAALGLNDSIRGADFSGGLKAGTSALLAAIESVQAGALRSVLVCTADSRLGTPGSPQELVFGDAASAFLVGAEGVVAEFKGSYSLTCDFTDHFRGQQARFDRQWEDRWIRDLGFDQFVPQVISGLLDKCGLDLSAFSKIVYPCHYPPARKSINKKLNIESDRDPGNLQGEIGDTGTAHALVMTARVLEDAQPGDKILVVSFGSGCDALYFEVTEEISRTRDRLAVSRCLAERADLDNYAKYLVWRNILPADLGLRSEEDLWTRWSVLWRKRKDVLGLWGTQCTRCDTPQFPAQRVCVNPECGAVDEMQPYRFSDKQGRIASYTGDMLAASYNPPAIYGQIQFEEGGKFQFDFTDCDLDELAVGAPVSMSFRRKYADAKRDIAGYFWKAVPKREDR